MNFLKNLFKKQKPNLIDYEFGELTFSHSKGDLVAYTFLYPIFDQTVNIYIDGNDTAANPNQKKIFKNLLLHSETIYQKATKELKEQLNNADLSFVSIENDFNFLGVSLADFGFELIFETKEKPYYNFNLGFEGTECIGTAIDR